uniref:Protein LMBR1L n=1 Tax=Meloidogyne incognita TaxID=6306 RepID=A0A914M211_MELIC
MDVLLEESTEEIVLNDAELQFYGLIRRHLICLIVFTFFYAISFCLIRYIKTRSDNDELYAGDEDYYVYRISTWICANSLSISIGAVTLLPFSVLGAEVLQLYPDNFYLKWLNFSLINTLWAYVFLLSNLSLFVLLPFSYFFIESQGFSLTLRLQTLSGSIGHPLLARFYEALVVCSLVLVILVGIADCLHAHLFARPSRIWYTLLYFSSLSAPLLYSLASLLGVFLLLLSVPLGFARLFDIFSLMLMTRNQIRLKSEGKRKSLDEAFDLNGIYFDAINPERNPNSRNFSWLRARLCGSLFYFNSEHNVKN